MSNIHHLNETRAAKIAEMKTAVNSPEVFDKLEAEVRALDKDIKRAATLAEFERAAETKPDTSMERELRSYSVARAVQGQLAGKLTGVEAEMHAELSKGRETRGVLIPTSMLLENRAQATVPDTAGGYTVATNLGGLIDRRRPTLAVQSMGATVLSGLVGNLDLPKLLSGPTAHWISEGEDTTASSSTFGKISMSPSTVSGEMQLSRRLMLQNAVALENILRADLGFVLAQALDKAAIAGTGTNSQPTGILTGITEATTADLATGFSDITADLIGLLEVDDVMGTGAFLTNPALMKIARKQKDADGHVIPQSELFHEKSVTTTNQVAAIAGENPLIYGAWDNLIIGYWSAVDILLNPYHAEVASNGGCKLHAFLDADIAIREEAAFAWKAI